MISHIDDLNWTSDLIWSFLAFNNKDSIFEELFPTNHKLVKYVHFITYISLLCIHHISLQCIYI